MKKRLILLASLILLSACSNETKNTVPQVIHYEPITEEGLVVALDGKHYGSKELGYFTLTDLEGEWTADDSVSDTLLALDNDDLKITVLIITSKIPVSSSHDLQEAAFKEVEQTRNFNQVINDLSDEEADRLHPKPFSVIGYDKDVYRVMGQTQEVQNYINYIIHNDTFTTIMVECKNNSPLGCAELENISGQIIQSYRSE